MKNIVLFLFIILPTIVFSQPTFNKAFQFDTINVHYPHTHFYYVHDDGKFIYVLGEQLDTFVNNSLTKVSFFLTLNQSGHILFKKDFGLGTLHRNFVSIGNDGFAFATSGADSLYFAKIYPLSDTITIQTKPFLIPYMTSNLHKIKLTSDKDFLITGGVFKNVTNQSGDFLIKIDSNGNEIWRNTTLYTYPEQRGNSGIVELPNGNYLSTSVRKYRYADVSTYELQSIMTILDTAGNILSIFSTDNNRLIGLGNPVPTPDKGFLFAGREGTQEPFGQTSYRTYYKGYVCKYDSSHQLVWEYTMDKFYDDIYNVEVLEDGSFIVSGDKTIYYPDTANSANYDSLNNTGLLMKFAADGTKLWERHFIKKHIQYMSRDIFHTIPSSSGGFISVGGLHSSTVGVGGNWGWIIRTDSFGCIVPGCEILDNTDNIPLKNNKLIVYPNPSSDYFNFRIDKKIQNGRIRVFNSLGQEVVNKSIIELETTIQSSTWQKGIYFYGIYEKERLVKQGQIVKQ